MTDAPAATPAPADEPAREGHRFEIAVAILLGLAALLTAFAAYRADIHSGDSIKAYQEGIRAVNDANQQYVEGNQQFAFDSSVFLEVVKASQEDNQDFVDYLDQAIIDEPLKTALDEWRKTGDEGPNTPFELDSYVPPAYVEADRLEKVTNQKFALAQAEDDTGDQWVLVTVFLASSLFLLGLAGVARVQPVRVGSLAAGTVVLGGSALYALTI